MKLFEQSSTSVVLKDANATIIAPQASYLVSPAVQDSATSYRVRQEI